MSRTAKSIQNSKVALSYSILVFIVGFISRKVFLDHLGAELLGLNTTVVNLLQFLNLAEMGVGTAIACTLYKPLHDNDQNTINEIISIQGWLYRNIALIVIGASVVLMCFFPMIFAKSTLPIWYAYATFSVMLFGSLLGYFVNYKQVILSANQEEYKVIYSYQLVKTLRFVFQIIALICFDNSYLWWLGIELSFIIISSTTLNLTIKKSAPKLVSNLSEGANLRYKYPEVTTKVKQIFVHKIAGFALTETRPLIIYAYTSLTIVAYYGNYLFLTVGLTTLVRALFNGMSASIGNLVAEGDENKIMKVFDEIYSSRFFLMSVLTLSGYILSHQAITLWVGSEYIMDNSTVVLMFILFFIGGGIRSTVDEFINAYGLFSDIWAAACEAILYVGCSILLGYLFGINGILMGTIISQIIIILCWKPYFLFSKGVKKPLRLYLRIFAQNILAISVLVVSLSFINLSFLNEIVGNKYLNFIISGIVVPIVISLPLFILQFMLSQGMRDFTARAKRMVIKS
ncbi:MAG: sugar transporter [Rikenellaceae bacterium]